MVSPIFNVFPSSEWRDDVIATWRCLQRHYVITTSDSCATHIHISVEPDYTLKDLQHIAASVIHFETAFEALVPEERRGNEFCKSNWLHSPRLAPGCHSRSESITIIERARNKEELIESIQKFGDRDFAWNFESLRQRRTIEFRKPPASSTPDEALSWAELALNFIQASIKYGSSHRLERIPSTIRGLRWFLRRVNVDEMNDSGRLNRLWAGKDEKAALEPMAQCKRGSRVNLEMEAQLLQLSQADMERVHANSRRKEPYWPRQRVR